MPSRVIAIVVGAIGVAMTSAVMIVRAVPVPSAIAGARMGTLMVVTTPPGAAAFVDGQSIGTTPATASLAAGLHTLELRGPRTTKTVSFTITAGSRVEQHVELPSFVTEETPSSVRVEPGVDVPRGHLRDD